MIPTRKSILVHLVVSLPFLLVSPGLAAQVLTPQAPETEPGRPHTVVLREGTEVNLRFAQKLTAGAAVLDQPVELILSEDLSVDDFLLVKRGARVLGRVTVGKKTEKNRTEAKGLAIRVDFLRAGDSRIRLRGEKSVEGKRNKDAMIAGTIFLGVSGLLATSGKHYIIPEGTPLKAYVDDDIELPVLRN